MRLPRGAGRLRAALAAVLLVAACGDAPPSSSPGGPGVSTAPATEAPAIDLPVPDEDTATTQVLLRSADGTYDVYASIGQLQGAPLTCTAVLLDTGESSSAPAYALTNGHCLGITDPNEVRLDAPADGMTVVFDDFIDRPERRSVPVTAVPWASMRGTDLAVLELGATPDELRLLGIAGWRPEALRTGSGATVDVVMVGVPVGVPLVDIPEDERYLRLGTCTLDADPVAVNERQWLWPSSLRNDCPEVLPGNSGSAVLDRATGALVGLINTTTYKGEGGAACWLGRPCEATDEGELTLPDTSYAQPVAGLEACFAGGTFALGGACPLDPGTGVTGLEGAPLAVNPAATDPLTGDPGRSTWGTTVATRDAAEYRYKIGPLGTTSCTDEAGYSGPVPVATPIDDPLPTTEQRLLLCVVAGGDTAHPARAVASIDTTPPAAATRFAVSGGPKAGWRIEPVFDPPELSLFLVKAGPAKATDCDDRDGYRPYRRVPLEIDAADAPVRVCAIGYDDADNAAEPAGKVLR